MRAAMHALAGSLLVVSLAAGGVSAHDAGGPGTSSNQATQVNPQAKALFDQGEGYSKEQKWDLAIAAYQQAVGIDPKYVEAWTNLAHAYRKTTQYSKALVAYQQAVGLKPDFPNAHEYLARTYLAVGNKDAAMREYEIVKRLDSKMAADLLKAIQANDPDLGDSD